MSALDAGKAYLAQILDKLPEAARAQAEAVFNDAAAAAAVSVLGEGVLMRQDYSRNLDQVRADQQRATELYNQNKAWYDANKADLDSLPTLLSEVERLRAEGTRPPASPTAPPAAPANDGVVKVEDFQTVIRESLGLHAVIPTLIAAHQVRFGEVLTEEQMIGLIQQAQQGQRSLKAQYQLTFAEKIAAKDAEVKAADTKRIQDEAVANYLRSNPNMPYPVRPTGSSPLDALKNPIPPADLSPDALAAEYNALVAGKV